MSGGFGCQTASGGDLGQRLARKDQPLGPVDAAMQHPAMRRNPRTGAKAALQVKFAQIRQRRQIAQPDRAVQMRLGVIGDQAQLLRRQTPGKPVPDRQAIGPAAASISAVSACIAVSPPRGSPSRMAPASARKGADSRGAEA